jgi:hypothetical protein
MRRFSSSPPLVLIACLLMAWVFHDFARVLPVQGQAVVWCSPDKASGNIAHSPSHDCCINSVALPATPIHAVSALWQRTPVQVLAQVKAQALARIRPQARGPPLG